jgi:hypothetical protein
VPSRTTVSSKEGGINVAKLEKDDAGEEELAPLRMWSVEFLALAGSAPDFPYPEEPLPGEPGPDFDEIS